MNISTAELSGEWEVEIVPLGQRVVLNAGQGELAPQCNSWCGASVSSVQGRYGTRLATVSVEIVHLAVENEMGIFTISMLEDALYGGLRLDESGEPLVRDEESPNFWLEGLMTIKFRLHGSDEVVSLVSRKPVLQVGRATSWPPYDTTMRDTSGPNEYYRADDPEGDPFLLLWSGSITIGTGPSPFVATDVTIDSFDYLGGPASVQGVKLSWAEKRHQVGLIDHYHLLRRRYDMHGGGQWERFGGCIDGVSATDPSFDGTEAVTYKVRQVFVDPLGDEVHGCGRETEFTVPALPGNRDQLVASGFWA